MRKRKNNSTSNNGVQRISLRAWEINGNASTNSIEYSKYSLLNIGKNDNDKSGS